MELTSDDAKTLREMVSKEWFPHKERELEATFGVGGIVDSTRFLAVAQRLKSKGLKETRQLDRLTISLEDNTRYTIQGDGTIAQYCIDNKLFGKAPVAMIKDRAGDLSTLDIKEYDTRVKIRRELGLDMNDPRVKSHLATWDQRVKFFRLIQRWTFVGKGVIFDLSMVRSTKKDDRGLWKRVTKFHDPDLHHELFKEQPTYEVEVELDHKSDDNDEPDKAIANLIQGIGEILRGIQRNPILIRNSVRANVLEGYKTLVGASEEPGKKGFRGVQPVTLERANMLSTPRYKVVNIRSGFNVTDKADGLRVMAYCDQKGELFMLDMSLNVYRTGLKKLECANTLLDGEWVTKNKHNEPVQMLMLFDIYVRAGESATSKVANLEFMHVEPSVPTRHKALVEWCAKWRSEGGPISLVKGLTPQNSLKVMEKKFLMAGGSLTSPSNEIFAKCAQMLSRDVNYNTDGLILTSNKEKLPERFGVRFNQQFKWKPSKDNTIDFLVKIVKDPATNQDKLTDIIRPDSSDTIKFKTLRLYIGTSADPAFDDPRRTILLIKKLPSGRSGGKGAKKYRMRPVLFTPKDFEDSMASVCYLEAKQDMATQEWISRCSTHDDAEGEATGDPITNNSIVEMRYDPNPSLPSGWNWVPIRVRYDKTERFQSGSIERTLNSVETAESVWQSIHDPITHHMITTGDDKPSEEEERRLRVENERSAALSTRYYKKKSTIKNVSLVRTMAMFHNLIIKGNILTEAILQRPGVIESPTRKVIDTSIGKGGDLGRYVTAVSLLVGIDIDADGIRDPDEGAYRRYLNMLVEDQKTRFAATPPMLFLIGDSSKSYADGSSGMNEEEADMMRAVFGKVPPAAKIPPYVESKFKGQYAEGADYIASMFSIHYYFETKAKWEGFLNNIRDNLKVGGYFTCCCFDGNIVTDLMKDLEKGDELEGVDPDTNATIWKITKQNTLTDSLPSTPEEGFGQSIDVEFLSIGSSHREYLVSPQLLVQQMRSIGCDLANLEDCAKMGLTEPTQSFQKTYESTPYNTTAYNMSDTVKQFSFFNRWYIFRRYDKAPLPEAPILLERVGTPVFGASTGNERPTPPPGYYVDYNPYTNEWDFIGINTLQRIPAKQYATLHANGSRTPPLYGVASSPVYNPQGVAQLQASTSPGYSPSSPVYNPQGVGQASTTPPYRPTNSPPYRPSTPEAPALPSELPPGWDSEVLWAATGMPFRVYVHTKTGKKFMAFPTLPPEPPDGLEVFWNEEGAIDFVDPATGDLEYTVEGDEIPGLMPYDESTHLMNSPPAASLAVNEAAAALNNRPPSSAWRSVPLSGDGEQNAALRLAVPRTPNLPPAVAENNGDENESPLGSPAFRPGAEEQAEEIRRWEAKKARLEAKAKAKSGLVTAVVEGGGRTVAVERATAAGPQKKYKASDIFRFFGRAELKDVLGIQDPGAARWLSLSAPFPIKDGNIEYPSVNHYLAGMKYKLSTDKPELAEDIFSSKGTIHSKYLRQREQIATKHKGEKEKAQVKEQEDQELLRSESADVADAALPKTIKRYKAQFNEAKWIATKDDVLKEALNQRWKHDARFRKIVEAARQKDKYLLYYTGSSTITSFGGIRRDDGRIEGENQVGKIIMELAGYPPT